MDFNQTVSDVRERFSGQGEQQPKTHEKLLSLVKRLKSEGKNAIASRIPDMEKADDIYRAYRIPDEDDKKAAERGEPIKIIYPVTFAQIQTTVAACMGVFNKVPMIELEGRGPQYHRAAKLMEAELQYQFDSCGWHLTLHQWLLDMLKYGFCELNVGYDKKYDWVTRKDPIKNLILQTLPMLSFMGLNPMTTEKMLSYEGATLWCEDPMSACFDPNISIGDIQKGQFVFSQERISYNQVKLEAAPPQSKWFNIDNIPKGSEAVKGDDTYRPSYKGLGAKSPVEGGDIVVIDTCYVKLCPRDYELSELNEPQIWCISMANESRIIRAEPSRFPHGQFPKAVIEFTPDLRNTTNDGMAQTIDGLQDITNWLLNTHMESVRQTVDNHFIIDPDGIEIEDIKERRRFWRLKRGKGSQGVDRFIKQLSTQDVTQGHVAMADQTLQFIQRTTGISDNWMGMQLPTTRSATEVQSINKLGSQRLKLLTTNLFEQGVRPLASQMIKNTQTWMESERFYKVTGGLAQALQMPPEAVNEFLKASPDDIQGMFNISMIDSSTPSDRMATASLLKEVIGMVVQNPTVAPALGINVQQVMRQMLMNFGIKNISDFLANPQDIQRMAAMAQATAPGGRGVVAQPTPDELVRKEVERGNAVPV